MLYDLAILGLEAFNLKSSTEKKKKKSKIKYRAHACYPLFIAANWLSATVRNRN